MHTVFFRILFFGPQLQRNTRARTPLQPLCRPRPNTHFEGEAGKGCAHHTQTHTSKERRAWGGRRPRRLSRIDPGQASYCVCRGQIGWFGVQGCATNGTKVWGASLALLAVPVLVRPAIGKQYRTRTRTVLGDTLFCKTAVQQSREGLGEPLDARWWHCCRRFVARPRVPTIKWFWRL